MGHKFFFFQRNIWIGLVFYTGMISACSFDYSKAEVAETLDETIADIEMRNATLYFVRGTTVEIHAKSIDIFSDRKLQDVYDIIFREIDRKGEVRMRGNAKQASIETDTKNVTLIGDIFVRSNKDEAEISTSYIKWNDEERAIEGSSSELIEIVRDDGSAIRGYGFRGDAETRELILTKGVSGELVVDE